MVWSVVLVAKEPRGSMIALYTSDLKGLFKMYQNLAFTWPSQSKIYHVEQHPDKSVVQERFELFSRATNKDRVELVNHHNLTWSEYTEEDLKQLK